MECKVAPSRLSPFYIHLIGWPSDMCVSGRLAHTPSISFRALYTAQPNHEDCRSVLAPPSMRNVFRLANLVASSLEAPLQPFLHVLATSSLPSLPLMSSNRVSATCLSYLSSSTVACSISLVEIGFQLSKPRKQALPKCNIVHLPHQVTRCFSSGNLLSLPFVARGTARRALDYFRLRLAHRLA